MHMPHVHMHMHMHMPCARHARAHPYTTGGRLGAPAAGAGGAGYMLAWERAPSGMCRTLSGHVRPGASVGYVRATRTRLPRWVRTGGAGGLPAGPHVLYVLRGCAHPPRAFGTYRVLWQPRPYKHAVAYTSLCHGMYARRTGRAGFGPPPSPGEQDGTAGGGTAADGATRAAS